MIIVVVVVAGLAGAWLFGQLSENAGAAPPPPQAREDQITIFADRQAGGEGGSFPPDSYFSVVWSPLLALDPGDYPPNTSFRFETTFGVSAPYYDICLRLFDETASITVPNSEVCRGPAHELRLRSGAIQLVVAEHEYRVQARCVAVSCTFDQWTAARAIAEWTERSR